MSDLTHRQLIRSGLAVSASSILSVSAGPAEAMTAASPILPVAPYEDAETPKTRERLLMDANRKFSLGNANNPLQDFEYGKLSRERTFAKSGRIAQAMDKFDDAS